MRTNFPRSIATRLLGSWSGCGGELRRENVSVFFSDVVGFTRLSSTMSAAKVASMLDRLFRRMDSLGREYGMEKIDVIGDAYIVACNFMELHEDDHALRFHQSHNSSCLRPPCRATRGAERRGHTWSC